MGLEVQNLTKPTDVYGIDHTKPRGALCYWRCFSCRSCNNATSIISHDDLKILLSIRAHEHGGKHLAQTMCFGAIVIVIVKVI